MRVLIKKNLGYAVKLAKIEVNLKYKSKQTKFYIMVDSMYQPFTKNKSKSLAHGIQADLLTDDIKGHSHYHIPRVTKLHSLTSWLNTQRHHNATKTSFHSGNSVR